jgi:hypothetical protein
MHEEPSAIQLERYFHRMLTGGELAAELNVSPNFILAMKRSGFVMPGRKASVAMARRFLADCPSFGVSKSIRRPATA